MGQEIEIEFKNLITKEQYELLLKKFKVEEKDIVRQRNHYFDTPDWKLKKCKSGLRIRETSKKIVCTLKEKTSENVHLETTDVLSKEQAYEMLQGNGFYALSVKEKLQQLHIPINELSVFGTLTTDRVEIPFKGGILVLDHSMYLNCDDYEVEYETNDENNGEMIFSQFLQTYNIEKRHTDKKIARLVHALNVTKG